MSDLFDFLVAMLALAFSLLLIVGLFLLTYGPWVIGLVQILKWAVGS